jgi:phage-related protein
MSPHDKPLVWLHGQVKSPPMAKSGRLEMGFLLRRLQRGESVAPPHSKPLPTVGTNCHELRVTDQRGNWRLVYRIDADAIVILEVFAKKTQKTPKSMIETCRSRLKEYENACKQTKAPRR